MSEMDSHDEIILDALVSISEGRRLKTTLSTIVHGAVRLRDADMSAIGLVTETGGSLEIVSAWGGGGHLKGRRLSLPQSLSRMAIRTNQIVRRTIRGRNGNADIPESAMTQQARRLVVVPLVGSGRPIGTMILAKREPWRFTVSLQRHLRQLACAAGIAVDRERLRRPLRMKSNRATFHLGPRERDIARLLLLGRSCREVASILGLSRRTVEHHVEHLKLRMEASTLHGLVARLVRASSVKM